MARHGTANRYRAGCKCFACTKYRDDIDTTELRWPLGQLTKVTAGIDGLRSFFESDVQVLESIDRWKEYGMSDPEADNIAVRLGFLPHQIWGGWFEAALDYYTEGDEP